MNEQAPSFHLMAKPAGPLCNLDCGYCFYLEKKGLFAQGQSMRMPPAVLRAYIEKTIAAQAAPEVQFTWQGGEPLLMGLEFFQQAVGLQQEFAGGKVIRNTIQTNGTLLDERWCAFFRRHGFLVGLSLDGPPAIHDAGRPDKQGRPTSQSVLKGLDLLQKHGVDVNILVTVARHVAPQPKAVYDFLKARGVGFIQFNPVVERPNSPPPPAAPGATTVSADSVEPEAYGDFLIAVFDDWVRHDVGSIHVMNFEWALAAWCQLPATVCLFAERCGDAAIVEHDGSVFSCDHYVYPDYRLGNIAGDDPAALLASAAQRNFGAAKETTLPRYCRQCPHLFACHGECPKNRFMTAPDGEPGLNYLCPGYRKYFRHITPAMNAMAQLLAAGRPAAEVMKAFKAPLAVVRGSPL